MSTYTSKLYLAKTEDGSQNWGAENRANLDVLDQVLAPQDCYFVSPSFTTANLGNQSATDRRHYPTIQEAIDAAQHPTSYSARRTIFVYPGKYEENLTITGTVSIVGVNGPVFSGGLSGIQTPLIAGAPDNTEPLVKFAPTGDAKALVLANLKFDNTNNHESGSIPHPYLLEVVKPAAYPTNFEHRVTLIHIAARMQTWGTAALFHSGITVNGWARLYMIDCSMTGLNYGYGTYTAGIRYLVELLGDDAAGLKAYLYGHDNRFVNTFTGDSNGDAVFRLDGGVYGIMGRSTAHSVYGQILSKGTTGTNELKGFEAGQEDAFGNLLGINLCFM